MSGKIRYETREDAETARRKMVRKPAGPQLRRAYACLDCGGWHLTKMEERPRAVGGGR